MKAFLRNQVSHKNVVELSFSNEESKQLNWEEEAEFSYRGEMYDVIEKKTEGNHIVIRCIADKNETALLEEYRKSTNRNSSNAFIAQLITADFILPNDNSLKQPEFAIKRNFKNSTPSLPKITSTISSPPPDVC